jgi:FKBP-type peptidyl-prolyl cis-trans isomerase (trigger factor)
VDEAAGEQDFIVMDYEGTIDGEPFAGGAGRDQLVELGSGRLVPGFEEQLQGARAGEERTVTITFPGRLRRRGPARQDGRLRRLGQGGQAQAPAGT